MHGPVNKNGIDQTNNSGQANRLFKVGRISIFDYQITNCLRQARLDITLFGCQYFSYQFLSKLFSTIVQYGWSTHLSERTFESCFSTYILYDPKKTKLQYVTGCKRLRKVLTGFISGHTLMFMHNIYFMHFSESSSKYIESKQSQTTLPFGWDDASCMKTLKSMVVNSYNAVSAATLLGILKYCMYCVSFLYYSFM